MILKDIATPPTEREVGHGHDKSGEARERTGLPSLSGTGETSVR